MAEQPEQEDCLAMEEMAERLPEEMEARASLVASEEMEARASLADL